MGKPFKLEMVGDVRGFLRASGDVTDALDKVADSLDDVARDSTDTADKMERRFSDAFRDVRQDAAKTGKAVGDDLRTGTRQAEEGLGELRDEAGSTAREAAASFSGSADDIVDMFQETAANAFAGFGPAGALAGVAVAAGIGLAVSSLQAAADRAADAKDRAIELAEQLADVHGNPAALDWATELRETLMQITDNKEWFEVWQDTPTTRLEAWAKAARTYGVDLRDVARGITGDQAALARVTDDLNRKLAASGPATSAYVMATGEMAVHVNDAATGLTTLRDEIIAQASVVAEATELQDIYNSAVGGLDDSAREAADAMTAYEGAVVDSLTEAGDSWEEYTKDGKTNLRQWNDAMDAQARAITDFEKNVSRASAHLSDEALNYVRSLGPKAAPLLQAFVNAPLAERQRAAANFDALGRASTDGYRAGLNLAGPMSSAIAAAQHLANRNSVAVRTALDSGGLSSELSRAVARLSATGPIVNISARIKGIWA